MFKNLSPGAIGIRGEFAVVSVHGSKPRPTWQPRRAAQCQSVVAHEARINEP